MSDDSRRRCGAMKPPPMDRRASPCDSTLLVLLHAWSQYSGRTAQLGYTLTVGATQQWASTPLLGDIALRQALQAMQCSWAVQLPRLGPGRQDSAWEVPWKPRDVQHAVVVHVRCMFSVVYSNACFARWRLRPNLLRVAQVGEAKNNCRQCTGTV